LTSGAPPAGAAAIGATRTGASSGPVLVVGYGNPLRSDDGVGPAVAERLAADPRMAGVDVRSEHQLTPELAADASGASLLVLVDAGAGEVPGEVTVRRLEPAAATGSAWTHHLDPSSLVGLARELWGSAPPVVLVSVGPASLEVGDTLSEAVAPAVARAAELVVAIVEEHRHA
jgi:hydrogenase maturation protease